MSSQLVQLIFSDQTDQAVQLALEHRTPWVRDQLRDDLLKDHAEQASAFLQQWLAALPALERLQAANWAVSLYVLDLVTLDHSFGTGASLYLSAQAGAAGELARAMRLFDGFTEGPDAEVGPATATRLKSYADMLDGMTFESDPPDEDGW